MLARNIGYALALIYFCVACGGGGGADSGEMNGSGVEAISARAVDGSYVHTLLSCASEPTPQQQLLIDTSNVLLESGDVILEITIAGNTFFSLTSGESDCTITDVAIISRDSGNSLELVDVTRECSDICGECIEPSDSSLSVEYNLDGNSLVLENFLFPIGMGEGLEFFCPDREIIFHFERI